MELESLRVPIEKGIGCGGYFLGCGMHFPLCVRLFVQLVVNNISLFIKKKKINIMILFFNYKKT